MIERRELVEQLRRAVIPQLRDCEQRLRARFPQVDTSFFEGDVGQLTDYQGHHFGLECVFAHVPPALPNVVALEVSVRTQHTTPEIDNADVAWGHPSGRVVADVLPGSVPLTAELIGRLAARIPELCTALEAAVTDGPEHA